MHAYTRAVLAALAVACLPDAGFAQNTTPANAVSLLVGQTPVRVTLPTGSATRYYTSQVVAGRSYCAEASSSETELNPTDAELTIYGADTVTVRVSNADATSEPFGGKAARACLVAPASETVYIAVSPHDAATENREYTMRFLETTLWANWFFIGGDYSSYTLIRNTTNTTLANIVITWRNQAGNAVGAQTVSLPGNGLAYIDARSVSGIMSSGTILGSVDIAHPGSPEAIVGSQTTLSTTTGLSFDTIMFQRRVW